MRECWDEFVMMMATPMMVTVVVELEVAAEVAIM